MSRLLVWDLPTRVFHWSLVISILGAYATAESERWRDIHVMLGYTALALIAFRIIWGFIGNDYARFKSFFYKPSEILDYAKGLLSGQPKHYIGHNPLGSLAIWLLLSLITALCITGIMLLYNIGGEILEEAHEILTFTLFSVVGIHICGVIMSSILHHENLVKAMLTGYKNASPQPKIAPAHAGLGIVLLLAVITFWTLYPNITSYSNHQTVHIEHEDED